METIILMARTLKERGGGSEMATSIILLLAFRLVSGARKKQSHRIVSISPTSPRSSFGFLRLLIETMSDPRGAVHAGCRSEDAPSSSLSHASPILVDHSVLGETRQVRLKESKDPSACPFLSIDPP